MLVLWNHAPSRSHNRPHLHKRSKLGGHFRLVDSLCVIAHQVSVLDVIELLLEILFGSLPLVKMVHLTVAWEFLLYFLEF